MHLGNFTSVRHAICMSTCTMADMGLRNILFISTNGGTGDLFWGYIVVFIGVALTYASLAEMASM